jgi:hypothetical protein
MKSKEEKTGCDLTESSNEVCFPSDDDDERKHLRLTHKRVG